MRSDNSVSSIRGVGPELADRLSAELDVESIDDLDDVDPADLVHMDGVGVTTFARLVAGEPERSL
jgi:Holliday junction resolvasome RuvABC DNA-binding subunit